VGLFRASRCPRYLALLLRSQLEQARVAEPVCAVRLHVRAVEPMTGSQPEFFETGEADGIEGASVLVDRLSSRLGREAVTRARMVADFQPEYACRFEPMIPAKAEGKKPEEPRRTKAKQRERDRYPPASDVRPVRPLRLWPKPVRIEVVSVVPDGPPVRLQWAGTDYHIRRARGPERIETGWWRGQDVKRDYYVVTTHLGTQFWIFRRREDGLWFMHGCFD
jgi:protein ImuB